MSEFSGPSKISYLYLKVAGDRGVTSLPLCEAVCDPQKLAALEAAPNLPEDQYEKLRTELQADLFGNKKKIGAFVIQPEGQSQTPEVGAFLEKFK